MVKVKRKRRALTLILTIILFVFIAPSITLAGFRGLNYIQAKQLSKQSLALQSQGKLEEAYEKLVEANSKWISENLRIEIDTGMMAINGRIADREIFQIGKELFDAGKFQEAKVQLGRVTSLSDYYNEAKDMLSIIEAKSVKPTAQPKKTVISTPKPTTIPTPSPTAPKVNILPNTTQQTRIDPLANAPRDSRGVLCDSMDGRCKYECSISDYWVDDWFRILNNHIWEYQNEVKISGPDSADSKIWENAVMSTYNTLYDYCINSPIFHPSNPL